MIKVERLITFNVIPVYLCSTFTVKVTMAKKNSPRRHEEKSLEKIGTQKGTHLYIGENKYDTRCDTSAVIMMSHDSASAG